MSWNNFDNSMKNEGGFMDTTMNETTGGGEAGKDNLKRGQNCIPVMIGQVLRYGEKLQVWGIPAKIVAFMAVVRKIEATSTKITFELQDETGIIKAVKWLEGDTSTFESPVQVNTYAKIFGLIRDQGKSHFVLIVNIQPMQELAELVAHLMEVTLVSLQGEKMVNDVGKMDVSISNGSMQANAGSNSGGGGGMTRSQQIILEIIQNSDPEFGAERDTIKAKVPPNMVSQVDEVIEFLSAEGHIYTTKTDDFFKAI